MRTSSAEKLMFLCLFDHASCSDAEEQLSFVLFGDRSRGIRDRVGGIEDRGFKPGKVPQLRACRRELFWLESAPAAMSRGCGGPARTVLDVGGGLEAPERRRRARTNASSRGSHTAIFEVNGLSFKFE